MSTNISVVALRKEVYKRGMMEYDYRVASIEKLHTTEEYSFHLSLSSHALG